MGASLLESKMTYYSRMSIAFYHYFTLIVDLFIFVGYTRKRFPTLVSDSSVKMALRNKITCIETKSKKKTPVD